MEGLQPITVMGYRCHRCGHGWVPRTYTTQLPRVCPKCKIKSWHSAEAPQRGRPPVPKLAEALGVEPAALMEPSVSTS